jgi:hypothetical protein
MSWKKSVLCLLAFVALLIIYAFPALIFKGDQRIFEFSSLKPDFEFRITKPGLHSFTLAIETTETKELQAFLNNLGGDSCNGEDWFKMEVTDLATKADVPLLTGDWPAIIGDNNVYRVVCHARLPAGRFKLKGDMTGTPALAKHKSTSIRINGGPSK